MVRTGWVQNPSIKKDQPLCTAWSWNNNDDTINVRQSVKGGKQCKSFPFCCTQQAKCLLLTSSNQTPCALALRSSIDLWPWLYPWPRSYKAKSDDKMQYITVWPWALTYYLDQKFQARWGHGQPHAKNHACRSNDSNIKSADKQTHKQLDRPYFLHAMKSIKNKIWLDCSDPIPFRSSWTQMTP